MEAAALFNITGDKKNADRIKQYNSKSSDVLYVCRNLFLRS